MSAGVIASHYVASGGGANPYSTEVLADSPLLYWKFDETSGTSAADSSGNSHAGAIAGSPTLNATKVMPAGSGAFTLDAGTKNVSVAAASWLNVGSWTAEAWINLTGTSSYHNVFNRDGASSRGWNLYVTGGKLNGFDATSDHLGTATLSTGTVYHVAITCDSATVKMYLNGALDASFSAAGGWLTNAAGASTSNAFMAGASYAGTGTPTLALTGNVDHVAYYGSVLSATRLAAHYAAASVGP